MPCKLITESIVNVEIETKQECVSSFVTQLPLQQHSPRVDWSSLAKHQSIAPSSLGYCSSTWNSSEIRFWSKKWIKENLEAQEEPKVWNRLFAVYATFQCMTSSNLLLQKESAPKPFWSPIKLSAPECRRKSQSKGGSTKDFVQQIGSVHLHQSDHHSHWPFEIARFSSSTAVEDLFAQEQSAWDLSDQGLCPIKPYGQQRACRQHM